MFSSPDKTCDHPNESQHSVGDKSPITKNKSELACVKSWFEEFSDVQKQLFFTDLLNRYESVQKSAAEYILRRKAEKAGVNFTNLLPYHLLIYLFSFLDAESLIAVSKVCWYCKLLADSNALWYLQCKQKNWELPNVPRNNELPPGFWKHYYLERSRFNWKKTLLSPSPAVITNTSPSQMSQASTKTTYLTVPEPGKVNVKIWFPSEQTSKSTKDIPTTDTQTISKRPEKRAEFSRKTSNRTVAPTESQGRMNSVPVSYITGYEDTSGPRFIDIRRRLVSPSVAKQPLKVERQWMPFTKGQPESPTAYERMKRALWLGQVRRRYSFKELNRRAKSALERKGNVTPCPHRKKLYSPIEPKTKCFAEVFASPCTAGSYSPIRGAVWPTETEDGFVELTKGSSANTAQYKPGSFTPIPVYLGDGDPSASLLSEIVTSYSDGDIHTVTELAHVTVSSGWERELAIGLLETVKLGPPIIFRALLSPHTGSSTSGSLDHNCSKMSYIPVSSQADLDNPATRTSSIDANSENKNLKHEQLESLTSPSICDRSITLNPKN
ncbi:F-box only protein 16, variant 2 [Clonorchis sinensis]|uniref:F-box only protein 16, variant 2 n=1 Tax=Clonorchis sinensis TaxID=79923 RepID=A0A8T1LX30_CLOSI|nr:F-box only protein 16, variant 2 [Clonorchis sinensis]